MSKAPTRLLRRISAAGIGLCAALLTTVSGGAQPRPLPEPQAFLAQTRARLDRDEDRQAGFVYLETQRRELLDGSGRVREEQVRIVESYPGLPGEARWERVLEEHGRKVPEADLQRADAERRKKAEEFARRLSRQSADDRREEAKAQAQQRRETQERVDDVFLVYELRMLGRESVDGHDTIVFSFVPRPNAAPKTREGKWLRSFKGRAWIDESDYELVRMEAEAIRDVSVGFWVLARIHQGTMASFARRKVDDERWLPAFATYSMSGRVLLFKRLHERGTTEFSNYRRFAVDTASSAASVTGATTDSGGGGITR